MNVSLRQFGLIALMLLTAVSAYAQSRKPKPVRKPPTQEQTTNSAPTLTPVFKAYCQAKIKNDEAALRRVHSQETLRSYEAEMARDKVKSLLVYLEDDKVSGKLCEVRNEQIQGDTAIAE